jgi:hypothetical protein
MCVDPDVTNSSSPSEAEGLYSPVMGYKEDLQKVHQKIDDLTKQFAVQGSRSDSVPWYSRVLVPVIMAAICSGLASYWVARWQLGQTRDDKNLDRRIEIQINDRLQPINEGIAKLREDMAYLRAKVEDATTRKIEYFSKLPSNDVQANLPEIIKTISYAREKQIMSPPESVIELRKKLAQVQPRNSPFWEAFSNVVSYQSQLAERMNIFPNAETVRNNPCTAMKIGFGGKVSGVGFRGCSQKLDGVSWKNSTFEDMIIFYDGGPVSLNNVTFKNCIFYVSFPEFPIPPAQKIGEALLSAGGLVPTFTISAG